MKAEAPGFSAVEKTGIELKAGGNARADVGLRIRADFKLDVVAPSIHDGGCCEYAAIPLKTLPENYLQKKKPFNYMVGESPDDKGTLRGIANLVYGDSKLWVQIFEANRSQVAKPDAITYGTSLLIPRKRNLPKLISKILPAYPPEAERAKRTGDVVLDVNLKADGTVDHVDVIEGDVLLADAAVNAIKQWRYRPLIVKGHPIVSFVVAVRFRKNGKVQIE